MMIRRKYQDVRRHCVCCRFALALAGLRPEPEASSGGPPPPAVTVAKPIKRTIVDQDEYVGRFVAVDSVEVRARVSGYLDKIHFTDGQMVKKGDLLFTIDKRPFQNRARSGARPICSAARAELAFAEGDLERAAQLVRDKTITEQIFDQRTQAKRVAEANVAAQEAAVRQAELDLEFTELRAPVTGRIGDRRVSPGNLVTGGTGGTTTLLATIVSTDPIRFEFTFDEASYLRYERVASAVGAKAAKKDDIAARGGSTLVRLKLIDEPDFAHDGRMDFVDNVIEQAYRHHPRPRGVRQQCKDFSRRACSRASRCRVRRLTRRCSFPDVAIGTEQARKFVYVVRPDDTVAQKYVDARPAQRRRCASSRAGLRPTTA